MNSLLAQRRNSIKYITELVTSTLLERCTVHPSALFCGFVVKPCGLAAPLLARGESKATTKILESVFSV